ncbi:GntR family transcriptional regulator [Rugamonas sp. A1-17]|nr:GntR family transcriptional regulator [Rugamonas sp. A1-17]
MFSHTATLFTIATGSSEPIYRQLIEQIRRLLAAGVLAPCDMLRSVRDAALSLAVNPMTVSKAYNLMETDGLLMRSCGTGMLVAECRAISTHERVALLRPTLERASEEVRQLELDPVAVLALGDQQVLPCVRRDTVPGKVASLLKVWGVDSMVDLVVFDANCVGGMPGDMRLTAPHFFSNDSSHAS